MTASVLLLCFFYFFFFNDTATTEIYTLSLHDALPISIRKAHPWGTPPWMVDFRPAPSSLPDQDRKSTRLNSSHTVISYAVFCLKKKKKKKHIKKRHKKDSNMRRVNQRTGINITQPAVR